MRKLILIVLFFSHILSCQEKNTTNLNELMGQSPFLEGNPEFIKTPYVTAGNRVYMVGHQDGSFPDLGWHIKGEMGGIWNHPIKLMDGFDIQISDGLNALTLNNADRFTNYPFANKHTYIWKNKSIEIERWQFVPDHKQGIIIQLIITNSGPRKELKVTFTGHSDLRPTWLGERSHMIDGKDVALFDKERHLWRVKDTLNEWYTLFGSVPEPKQGPLPKVFNSDGNTTSSSLESTVTLLQDKKHVITYFITGSYTSEKNAIQTYEDLKNNYSTYFKEKQHRYHTLAEQSKLTIPDKDIQETFEWLKYNCDWLVRTVPEIGTGIGAGIPDYPWWFGVDSEYALKGYMAIGQDDIVYKTVRLLDSLSNVTNGNGRIIHEVSTNGVVFNKGNINETPQFISLLWEIYKWNGDKQFLKSYFPTLKKGLDWLLVHNDTNNNLFPDGFGMMEIHGLDTEMIDVASYTQRAFDDASKIAFELQDTLLSKQYKAKADLLRSRINSDFWSETFNSYADFIGTDDEALHLIDDAILRADTLGKPWAVKELKNTKVSILNKPSQESRPFVLYHNWVVNTPMEMQIADRDKAIKALETAETFVNPFGVFVTGIDRDESASSDDGSFKGSKIFSYTGAVMTLPTGVQVVAENNYGRTDKALNYLKRMSRTFSYALPGSMYEVSPDYGMMTQAWTIYGFAIPIVQQFFGINPEAHRKKIVISPQMPDSWNDASLENVIIADNVVSVFYQKREGKLKIKVLQDNPSWEIKIILPEKMNDHTYKVMKSKITPRQHDQMLIFNSKARTTELLFEYN